MESADAGSIRVEPQLIARVNAEITAYYRSQPGYQDEPNANPMTPYDGVAAFALAEWLVQHGCFEECVAVAPEGYVYGYFFKQLGVHPLAVHVDYPPRRCVTLCDLAAIRERRILILEDDVVSGITLQLVVAELCRYKPKQMSLFLGRRKSDQLLENVPAEIEQIYLAEDVLDRESRLQYERRFADFFGSR